MDVCVAARIVALRPALESLIIKTTSDPDTLSDLAPQDMELVNVVRAMSHQEAGRHNIAMRRGATAG